MATKRREMQPEVRIRIVVVNPPAGVTWALQRDRSELEPPLQRIGDSPVFEFLVRVGDANAQPPRLLGPYTQGPPDKRFVYLNSGTLAGQPESCWTRRAKVPLFGLPSRLLAAAVLDRSSVLQASIAGTGRDGGPVCASVPLLADWTLAR